MIIAALMALALMRQDTTPGFPPRARAMLATFPLPREGEVLVTTRFSKDSAWIGEQVELLTAAWFPEGLRSRLRRSPTLTPPALSGLWSTESQGSPMLAGTRRVGNQMYAVYVQYQTLFPLGAGRIQAQPAELGYSVPTSSSYFAPEDRKSVSSRSAVLYVRPIPAAIAGSVGNGPTADDMRVTWLGPVTAMRVGVPAIVELSISGAGNVTLWPAPDITWPGGLRVYSEQTTERARYSAGVLGGEKHFRFTVVADSAGIYSLPRVRYTYFSPTRVEGMAAVASSFTLPVLPAKGSANRPAPPVVTGVDGVPLATELVDRAWPLLLLLGALPPVLLLWERRTRPPPAVVRPTDGEAELRHLLQQPADSGPERVTAALRHRGVPRDEAEQLHRWLTAVARRRYGPVSGDAPAPPKVLADVLRRLRAGTMLLLLLVVSAGTVAGQASEAARRFQAGDYPGAVERLAKVVEATPGAEDAWRDLGSARWMNGDDAGAATAWLRAFALSPRDPILRDAWRRHGAIPTDVRDLAPVIPLSRDELWLLALTSWLAAWGLGRTRHRRWMIAAAGVALLSAATAGLRWYQETRPRAILRSGIGYRVSPGATAPELGSAPGWTIVTVSGSRAGWVLAVMPDGRRGWIPVTAIAPLAPLD